MKLVVGTTINNRYQITAELGRGVFAQVYLAQDLSLGRKMVLKVFFQERISEAEV